jgi:predicted esterase
VLSARFTQCSVLNNVRTLLIPATVRGRVLVRDAPDPRGMLIGFHGYMENAEIQMARLESIPRCENWTLVSVLALNRFYRGRSQEVIAGWMTRQDRETAIEDNIDYVDRVVAATRLPDVPLAFAGFSQGAAMAFRAAVRGKARADGIISVGGDVPPELLEDESRRFPPALLARGEQDEWYTAAKLQSDVSALNTRGAAPEILVYAGGHEWTAEVSAAAGAFLSSRGW